jgi:hypothetical protein
MQLGFKVLNFITTHTSFSPFLAKNSFFKVTASVVIVIYLLPSIYTNSLAPLLYLKYVSTISLLNVAGAAGCPVTLTASPVSYSL